jgi:hypothetical protein
MHNIFGGTLAPVLPRRRSVLPPAFRAPAPTPNRASDSCLRGLPQIASCLRGLPQIASSHTRWLASSVFAAFQPANNPFP